MGCQTIQLVKVYTYQTQMEMKWNYMLMTQKLIGRINQVL